jgi:hypothetical protein
MVWIHMKWKRVGRSLVPGTTILFLLLLPRALELALDRSLLGRTLDERTHLPRANADAGADAVVKGDPSRPDPAVERRGDATGDRG